LIEEVKMSASRYMLLKVRGIPSGAVVLILSGLLLLSGCSVHNSKYGKYQTSNKVLRMFENENLPPDYQYFHMGTLSEPLAIIGLKPPYTLDNDLWTRTDLSQMKRLKENMFIYVMYSPLFGSQILGSDGQEIGIFYSRWKGDQIVLGSNDKVNIHFYDPDDVDRKN